MGSVPENKRKKIPKNISEMSKEMLRETLKKKKECNAKAQNIVEVLCEIQVDEDWFLNNLHFINQSHFDDITVERSILKICGYPLCDKRLEKILPQQYHISVMHNKVYDITERKKFCSSFCFKAAMYIKNQLYTSPLWFRDHEVIKKYALIKPTKSSKEPDITFLLDEIKNECNNSKAVSHSKHKISTFHDHNDDQKINSRVDFTMSDGYGKNGKEKNSQENKFLVENKAKFEQPLRSENSCDKSITDSDKIAVLINLPDNNKRIQEKHLNPLLNNIDDTVQTVSVSNVSEFVKDNALAGISNLEVKLKAISVDDRLCNINENVSKRTLKVDSETVIKINKSMEFVDVNASISNYNVNELEKSKLPQHTKYSNKFREKTHDKNNSCNVVEKVETAVFEWFSIDTLFFLYEDKKVKELFSYNTSQLREALNAKLSVATYDEKIEKIIRLYGLLDTDALNCDLDKGKLKPLPDYSVLQEEGKALEIKVKAFYKGQLEVKDCPKDEKIKSDKTENTDLADDIYLPLIDSHAQNMLRRKIILDKLNQVLPILLRTLDSNYNAYMSEVRKLVSTFSLAAHNITFKPTEWNLIGLILIKLLSIKNKCLHILLQLQSSQSQLDVILNAFGLESNYLDILIDKLTDGNNIKSKVQNI